MALYKVSVEAFIEIEEVLDTDDTAYNALTENLHLGGILTLKK